MKTKKQTKTNTHTIYRERALYFFIEQQQTNNNNKKCTYNIMQIHNYLHFKCEFVFYHENQFESNYLLFLFVFFSYYKNKHISRKWHAQLM